MKCYMIVGADVDNGVYNIKIESVTGVFPLNRVDELTTYINDTLPSLDIYDCENFEDVQGYIQLTIYAGVEYARSVNSNDATFKILESYYHGYI